MSHIVTITSQARDPAALAAACRRRRLAPPVNGTHRLYSAEARGYAVRLRDWNYPVVFDTQTGEARYDNYGGAWGKQEELDRYMQAYAIEKAKIEARKAGHQTTEQTMPDGSIRLVINTGA